MHELGIEFEPASGFGRFSGRCLILVRPLRVLQLLGNLVGVRELGIGRQLFQAL